MDLIWLAAAIEFAAAVVLAIAAVCIVKAARLNRYTAELSCRRRPSDDEEMATGEAFLKRYYSPELIGPADGALWWRPPPPALRWTVER